MKNRLELFVIFQFFYNEIKNQFRILVQTLHNDNACNYPSHFFKKN